MNAHTCRTAGAAEVASAVAGSPSRPLQLQEPPPPPPHEAMMLSHLVRARTEHGPGEIVVAECWDPVLGDHNGDNATPSMRTETTRLSSVNAAPASTAKYDARLANLMAKSWLSSTHRSCVTNRAILGGLAWSSKDLANPFSTAKLDRVDRAPGQDSRGGRCNR